jgi:hypothetical protein
MSMKWSDLPLHPEPRVLRQFAAAWLVFFGVQAGLQRHSPTAGLVLGALAGLGLVGLWQPRTLRWLFIAATVLAFPIGWLVSQFLLAVMLYLVLTPVALVLRLRGRDVLQLRRRRSQTSFWHDRAAEPEPERYLKQF